MKKLILLLAVMFSVSIGAQAQKADKDAAKAEAAAQTQAMLKAVNFQFNPSDVQTKTGSTVRINQYEYMRVYPDRVQIRMTKIDPKAKNDYYGDKSTAMSLEERAGSRAGVKSTLAPTMLFDLETTTVQVLKNEAGKGSNWELILKVQTDAIYTMTFKVNTETGMSTLRVDSNKEESFTYKGKIVPN